ncbi:MAG: insulinase family protein [Defluviitaleaceae bacterium]|nr:insulinase family protein [Defluviitaleaceae bacterium]
MSMKNFKLLETMDLKHMPAQGNLYQHTSGASILHLKSDDTNKVFSISFKTPPTDNTGIAHIIEHSVLNGSKKYPIKDPFMQLIKGSLYTFLNAFTYPDKTVYPVGSVNDADFLNLMDVYLDAVFFPLIYDRKEVLDQEGWYFQLEKEDDPLTYNGVVYNEMKGAYADPYRLLYNALDRALLADSTYKFESGGNPENIPDITNEDYLNFHKKYYRPENAFIYFYGDMDIELCFKKLDEEYLSKFEKTGEVVEITPQPPIQGPVFVSDEYSVTDEEDLEENYAGVGYILPVDVPQEDVVALKLLNYILISTPASPLYKAFVEGGIGEDVSGSVAKDILHPVFNIVMKNCKLTQKELQAFVEKTLEDIAKNGLDYDFVEACINFFEFQAKEEDFGPNTPKGLVYNLRALTRWLYGETPWEALNGITILEEIREKCKDEGYLKGLIQKYFIDNNHKGYATINPVLGLDEKQEKATEEKLAAIKAKLSDEEKEAITQENKALKAFQEAEDPQELIEKIPQLSLLDIKTQVESVPLHVKKEGDMHLLHAPLETNGIIYTTFAFDMSSLPVELLPVASILQYTLSKVATKNHDMAAITQQIKGNLGGLAFSLDNVQSTGEGGFTPFAIVSSKFLKKNTPKMFGIIKEIVHHSVFDDKTQLKNYLLEMKSALDDTILTSGTSIALMRSMTYFSPLAAYQDATNGLGFYDYIRDICENFDAKFEKLKDDLQAAIGYIYNQNNASYSLVANDDLYKEFTQNGLVDFHDALPKKTLAAAPKPQLITPKNEGIITASKVQYCALSANFVDVGYSYDGGLKVLSNVVDNYLYEEIRVKGGAYGYGSSFERKGNMYMYSYRDPEVEATYGVYKKAACHIRNLDISQKEIEKYILGAIRVFDKPASNAHKGLRAISNHMQGITLEMRQKERDEVLSTDLAKIKSFADILEEAVAQNYICAVGNGALLEESKLFTTMKKV